MVNVAVCALLPVMLTDGVTVQVAGLVAPVGPVTAQLRATEPVKPPSGVSVMVPVPVAPGLVTETLPSLVSAKLALLAEEPVTAAVTAAVWMNWPVAVSLPVMEML